MGALLVFWIALVILAFALGGWAEGAGFLWFMVKFVGAIFAFAFAASLLSTAVDRVQEWREYRRTL